MPFDESNAELLVTKMCRILKEDFLDISNIVGSMKNFILGGDCIDE